MRQERIGRNNEEMENRTEKNETEEETGDGNRSMERTRRVCEWSRVSDIASSFVRVSQWIVYVCMCAYAFAV